MVLAAPGGGGGPALFPNDPLYPVTVRNAMMDLGNAGFLAGFDDVGGDAACSTIAGSGSPTGDAAGRITFGVGSDSGESVVDLWDFNPFGSSFTKWYHAYYWRLSSPFYNNSQILKHANHFYGGTAETIVLKSTAPSVLNTAAHTEPFITTQDHVSGSLNFGTGRSLALGAWHLYELLVERTGRIRLFINGTLDIDTTNTNFPDGIGQVGYTLLRGGPIGDVVPAGQTSHFDISWQRLKYTTV